MLYKVGVEVFYWNNNMHSDVSIARVKQFPELMWILLFGAFITRGSYYMVWPFLSVILYNKFGISATAIGTLLTLAALTSVLVGFIGGTLSDRFGRKKIMYFSGVLYIFSFSLLANINSILGYAVVITLCSIATEIWRPATSALIGDIIKETQTRELAMQSLYFMVNVGSAIGPMIGLWLGLTGEPHSFYITAIAFALLLVLLIFGFRTLPVKSSKTITPKTVIPKTIKLEETDSSVEKDAHQTQPKKSQFSDTIKLLLKDHLLQCLILANILCMFIYGQMDSTLIQYLTRAETPKLLELISSMILTNALVIISSQFILLKLMAKIPLVKRIQIGLGLLTISQAWMATNPVDLFWGWIGAIIIMSLAETILFPTMNVHIDRLAPEHLRGAYFGATSFYSLGFALAPLGGGLILDYLSGPWVYITCTLLCIIVIYLYSILEKFERPKETVST
ncbi:MDR family MFS transporter [Aliikangiella sp. IMCC44359]|uniref:MDR family MFS transporter n=1 Tax=Aliikangiella sp. IMCC44359 TaxID=3459125 RepID=UPI00403AE2CB